MTKYEKLEKVLKFFKLRDTDSYRHFFSVGKISLIIAEEYGVNPPYAFKAKEGAFFHDIGKVFIPDNILLKKGTLTTYETDLMKNHVKIGTQIVDLALNNSEISEIVAQHHESYDGTGYPEGLSGDEICLGARICKLADCFDTIYHGRCYLKPCSFEEAVEKINSQSELFFAPDVVQAFNRCSRKIDAFLYTHLKKYNKRSINRER